jgi:hypothetical protein
MHAEHAIGRFLNGGLTRACRVMASVPSRSISSVCQMLRLLLPLFLVMPIGLSIASGTECDDELVCVLVHDGEQNLQLWAIPNRQGIDVQSFADKHLPVTYVNEMGLVIRPPRNVKVLNLSIRAISEKQTLLTIDLSGTNVTDDDVGVLSTIPNLECLVLDSTKVTDACLEHLKNCKKLRLLSLHGCNVSNDQLNLLQRSLPGLVRITGDGHTLVSIREKN